MARAAPVPLMLPDFVILGAQKAGSTALSRALAEHPEVYTPPGETRHFRDPWYRFEGLDAVERELAPAGPGVRRFGIKCPDYLLQPNAPERLHRDLGEVDLMAVLREPVSRAISSYFWAMQFGLLPVRHPDVGLSALLDGWTDPRYPRAWEILAFGDYAEQLERYLRRWPRDKLLVLLDDDLHGDRVGTLAQVWRFLGVDPMFTPASAPRRVNEGVYPLARLRVLRARHPFILRAFPGHEGRVIRPATGWRRMPDGVVAGLDRVVLRRLVGNARPPVDPGVRRRLAERYAPGVAALADLLGRDLSAWRRSTG